MVLITKSSHDCFLQVERDASTAYDPNSGWIAVSRKCQGYHFPKNHYVNFIGDDSLWEDFSISHGKDEVAMKNLLLFSLILRTLRLPFQRSYLLRPNPRTQ
jgi:hypothetical protein